jgi:hypothetical protein
LYFSLLQAIWGVPGAVFGMSQDLLKSSLLTTLLN